MPQRYFIQFCKHHAHAVSPTFISLLISKINPWNCHILFQIKLATQWYAFCYFFPMKLFFYLNFMLYSQNFWKCREQENISSNFHLVGLNGKSLCHDVTFIYRDGRSPSFDFMLSYYNGKSPSHDVMSIWNSVYSKYYDVTFTYGDVVFTGHFIKLYFCDLMMT